MMMKYRFNFNFLQKYWNRKANEGVRYVHEGWEENKEDGLMLKFVLGNGKEKVGRAARNFYRCDLYGLL